MKVGMSTATPGYLLACQVPPAAPPLLQDHKVVDPPFGQFDSGADTPEAGADDHDLMIGNTLAEPAGFAVPHMCTSH